MATFRIRKNDWTSLVGVLSVQLFPVGGASIANGVSGDLLTLVVGSGGLWEATVAEALSGLHMFVIYLDAFPIFEGTIDIISGSTTWVADLEYPILSTDSGATELLRGAAGVQVVVLPGFFVNQRRNSANAIDLYIGEVGTFTVPVIDGNKEPLDLSSKNVELRFANSARTLIATIDADSSSPGSLSFMATSLLTAAEVLQGTFSIRDKADETVIAPGIFAVRFAP